MTKNHLILAVSLAVLILASLPARAAVFNWNCVDGNWTASECWSPIGAPGLTDDVIVGPVSSSNTLLSFDATTGTQSVNSLLIDSATGITTTLQQSGGLLTTGGITIGNSWSSNGSYEQSGGTNMTHILYLGSNWSSNGNYTLSGNGNLSTNLEYIGYYGTGNFVQTGGTHTVGQRLYLGYANSGSVYTLSGGSLLAADEYILGGNFIQSGGTHTVNSNLKLFSGTTYTLSGGALNATSIANSDSWGSGIGTFNFDGGTLNLTGTSIYGTKLDVGVLNIANAAGSNVNFTLSSGNIAAGAEYVGVSGDGSFTQTGGTNRVNDLFLGNNAGHSSTYNISGGTLAAGAIRIGNNGTGSFTQNGGFVGGTLYVGAEAGVSGQYSFTNGILVGGEEKIGVHGIGNFDHTGGSNDIIYFLYLGYGATGSGVYNLSGTADLKTERSEYIGYQGTGTFNQSGGTHAAWGDFYVAAGNYDNSSNGTYNLTGGTLTIGGNGNGAKEYVGQAGNGIFNQSGGTHTILRTSGSNGSLYLGYLGGSNGIYNLSGTGSLSTGNSVYVGVNGNGTFNQDGGIHAVQQILYVGGEYGSGNGTYNLANGTLSAVRETIGGYGYGVFNQTGGVNTVSDIYLGSVNHSGGVYNLMGGILSASHGIRISDTGVFNIGSGAAVSVGSYGIVNEGGLIKGTGAIVGNVTSHGTVGPGSSPGILYINGNYIQSPAGRYTTPVLDMEVGGLLAGYEHDQLNISGTAFLDGLLNVSLYDLGGGLFMPHAGDFFDILTADVLFGSFSSMNFAALSDPNLFWRIDYLADAIGTTDVVRLSVGQNVVPPAPVPEPETYAMLLAGLGLLSFTAKRRRLGA